MLSEMKQNKVSWEIDCVCLCGTYLTGNWSAQLPCRVLHSSSTCATKYLQQSLAVNRQRSLPAVSGSVITPGGCPPPQKQEEFMPLPIQMEGYLFDVVPHLGKENSVFPRVEKHLLCGRENFLQTSTEIPHFTLSGVLLE